MSNFFRDLFESIKGKKMEVFFFLIFVIVSVWLGVREHQGEREPSGILGITESEANLLPTGFEKETEKRQVQTEDDRQTDILQEESAEESVTEPEFPETEFGETESGETESGETESGETESGETESEDTETGEPETAEDGSEEAGSTETEFPEEAGETNAEEMPETEQTESDTIIRTGISFWQKVAQDALKQVEKEKETPDYIHPELPKQDDGYLALAQKRKEAAYPALESYRRVPGAEIPLQYQQPTVEIDLEKILSAMIDTYDGEWSVWFRNLKTGKTISIHPQPMKSASVMKLFVMGAVYREISLGKMERTDEITSMLKDMVTYSDNEDSNRLLYLLGNSDYAAGIGKVNDFIRDYGFSDQTIEFNGFNSEEVVLDRTHMNQVTAEDCGKILEAIYRREWGSRMISEEIETMLLAQNTRDKIPRGLPENTPCANKTGEMDKTENDAAIVFSPAGDYILVVLTNGWESKDTAIERIRKISSKVYNYTNQKTDETL